MFSGLFRATNVLKHYRGFELPSDEKFTAWISRLLEYPAFKKTCSTEELYLESYERCISTSVTCSNFLPLQICFQSPTYESGCHGDQFRQTPSLSPLLCTVRMQNTSFYLTSSYTCITMSFSLRTVSANTGVGTQERENNFTNTCTLHAQNTLHESLEVRA
jgi:hypothetical protein